MDETGTLRIDAAFPPKLIGPLFTPNRYKILYGGRGGGKSWAIARALLIKAVNARLRILCVREFMSSVSDSVHKLLANQIIALGLQDHFIVEKATIQGINGSEFRFAGIRNNVSAIKSFEGIDVVWCEEAANISQQSWETLIPTVRKVSSEIIISFNPELETDYTWQHFVLDPPPRSIVIKINFDDNPFFPTELVEEMEYLREHDPDGYRHIYLGYPKVFLDNAIYGRELRVAIEDGRVTKVPYDPAVPVHCFYDLGWRDHTAIIFAQVVGFEFHLIDYVQDTGMAIKDYMQILQRKPYIYGTDYVPHDAVAKSLGSGRSIQEVMVSLGRKVKVVPRLAVHDGINAARTIFDRLWIDEVKCAALLKCLRCYRYDLSGARPEPVHDESSHGADAFRYMALSLRAPKAQGRTGSSMPRMPVATGWMA